MKKAGAASSTAPSVDGTQMVHTAEATEEVKGFDGRHVENTPEGRRMVELSQKSLSLLPPKDQQRAQELKSIPRDKLTREEYQERLRLGNRALSLLPPEERKELETLVLQLGKSTNQ